MCGIVYSKSFTGKPVAPTILKRFKEQRSRGVNGFGFYVPEINRLTHNPKESRILSLLARQEATEILFHHRWPTSTSNVRNACHPFSTKDYFPNNYIIVHNGVVTNSGELRAVHEKLGIKYVSEQEDKRFNDSEALTYDIARYLEGDVDKISARGSIAFIAIKRNMDGKATHLFWARNYASPLMMRKTDFSLTISSEGKGDRVDMDKLYCFNYDTHEITTRKCEIPGYSYYNYQPSRTFQGSTHKPHQTNFVEEEEDEVKPWPGYEGYWDGEDLPDVSDVLDEMENEAADQALMMKQGFLVATNNNIKQAMRLAQNNRTVLEDRQDDLDNDNVTNWEVGEWLDNQDKIAVLTLVIALLDEELKKHEKEGRERKPAGFRLTPEHLRKEKPERVPYKGKTQKLLRSPLKGSQKRRSKNKGKK